MKPISLCFIQMGEKGLELVSNHPKVLPRPILDAITYKAMPLGAQPGDFYNSTIGKLHYVSYILRLTRKNERDNIAAFVAVFSNTNYDGEIIQQDISKILSELEKKALLKTDIIESIMPSIFEGFKYNQIKITFNKNEDFEIDISKKNGHIIEDDIW